MLGLILLTHRSIDLREAVLQEFGMLLLEPSCHVFLKSCDVLVCFVYFLEGVEGDVRDLEEALIGDFVCKVLIEWFLRAELGLNMELLCCDVSVDG